MQTLHDALTWRYATKQFDSAKKLTNDDVMKLLDTARLSPSWYGLQPWRFILVENPETRAKLRESAYGQSQVTEASHLVVLAHKTTLDEAYVDTFIASSAQAANVTPADMQGLKDAVMGFVGIIKDNPAPWAANQTHIALGTLVAAASLASIDNCPMGGFDPNAFDEILGLKELNLHATAIVALGHRSESDPAASRAKSRFTLDEVVITR